MKTYVLIDRSGSMGDRWGETVAAIGAFMQGLKKKAKVHIAVFDTGRAGRIDYLCLLDGKAKEWKNGIMEMHPPRGMTPLWDATAMLATVIAETQPDKAQIVLITDGHENASKECSNVLVRKIVKGWKKKGYDVIYIGASFADADVAAVAMGINSQQTVNMSSSKHYGETMSAMSTRNAAYASGDVDAKSDLGKGIRDKADGKK